MNKKTPLRQARLERGLSPERLAADAELSSSHLYRLEVELYPHVTLPIARRLARVLGRTVDELFPPPPPGVAA
jgi:DNA-binding XRE family transcriptional regulator